MKNPFDYFDKIFCINLDSRPDRWEQVQKEFDKLGILGRVERISATTKEQIPYHPGGGKATKANGRVYDLVNAFATSLSHHSCLIRSMESNASNYLVFEDDVYFENYDEEYLKQSLVELPTDWEVFMMGYNDWNRTKCEDFSSNLYKVDAFGLAHAYSVNNVFFERYKSEFENRVTRGRTTKKRQFKRIEFFLSWVCREIFLVKDKFAFQEEGISNIYGEGDLLIDREAQ